MEGPGILVPHYRQNELVMRGERGSQPRFFCVRVWVRGHTHMGMIAMMAPCLWVVIRLPQCGEAKIYKNVIGSH